MKRLRAMLYFPKKLMIKGGSVWSFFYVTLTVTGADFFLV